MPFFIRLKTMQGKLKLNLLIALVIISQSSTVFGSDMSAQSNYNFSLNDGEKFKGNIYISLAYPVKESDDIFNLLFSTHIDAEELGICHFKESIVCEKGTDNYFGSQLIFIGNNRKYFTSLNRVYIEEGLTLEVRVYDRFQSVIDRRLVKFTRANISSSPDLASDSSGEASSTNDSPNDNDEETPSSSTNGDNPSNTQDESTSPITAAVVRPIIQNSCEGGGCHANNDFGNDPESLRTTNAISRIESGNMPIGRTLSSDDQEILLRYLRRQ